MYTAQGKIDKSGMLTQYAPLVRRLALQLIAKLPASVELDDMIQAGMLGLLDATNRYQENQGAQFATYASQRIRGAMLDELRANDWLSRSSRQSSRSVAAAVQSLEQKLGRGPTEGEIAEELKMPLDEYQQLLQEIHGCQLVYYEDFEGGNTENTFLDQQSGDHTGKQNGPLDLLLEQGLRHRLIEAIEAMPERERLLLSLYYEQELNLREIGAILEVSQSRVCQLHSQAVSRLRARLHEAG
ncbi:RNA polymerase sigma factor FliA [Herminiimonas sp. CN]|uniref:RNA polymerase sigma factor FliA n=1 Tax=Herminiimonas sp. CN TaxID=1349818 RepID=UPI0004732DE5|nr:RNA polymerase sigma factor FliA [Herminiimonas sp. CN]